MFQALLYGRDDLLVEVAAAFGAMHRWLLLRNRNVRWPARLSEQWIRVLWFRAEARIASALASMWSDDAGGFSENLKPGGLRFSWTGRDLAARMLGTLRRRTLDGAQGERSPFSNRLFANKSDAIAFLERQLDDEVIENLTFAFLLAKAPERKALKTEREKAGLPWLRWPAYSILKQFFSAATHPNASTASDEPRFRPDLSIANLLAGNQIDRATDTALRRLRIAGARPVVTKGWNSEDGVRLGAALLIPVRGVTVLRESVTRVEEEAEFSGAEQ
jgi:CRISPR-associated protein Csx17